MPKYSRARRSYVRPGPVREAYDHILIVCEGTKSEPNYFNRLRHVYRLSNANVKITPADGTDPMSVVAFAEQQLAKTGYDRAYCVFDRNGHVNYSRALQQIANSQYGKASRLLAIPSVPCFEIWVLLHFSYSSAPFTAVGNVSACDQVVREVQKYLPGYAKGFSTLFDALESHMDRAVVHAIRLEKHNGRSGSDNPATLMHKLVDYLRKLKP